MQWLKPDRWIPRAAFVDPQAEPTPQMLVTTNGDGGLIPIIFQLPDPHGAHLVDRPVPHTLQIRVHVPAAGLTTIQVTPVVGLVEIPVSPVAVVVAAAEVIPEEVRQDHLHRVEQDEVATNQ